MRPNWLLIHFLFTLQPDTCQPPPTFVGKIKTFSKFGKVKEFKHGKWITTPPCHYTNYECNVRTEPFEVCIDIAIDTCTTQSTIKIPIEKVVTNTICEDGSRKDCIDVPYPDCEEVPFVSSKQVSKEVCDHETKQECSQVPFQTCGTVPVTHSKLITNLVCEDKTKLVCNEFANHVCSTSPKTETKEFPTCHCSEEMKNVCFDIPFQKCIEIPSTKLDVKEVCTEKTEIVRKPVTKEVCHDETVEKCVDIPEQSCSNDPVNHEKIISKEICDYFH